MPSTTDVVLLDANVLIALAVQDHEHHMTARSWFGSARRFATTPSTQGSLVRFVVRVAGLDHALDVLAMLNGHARHEFWPDAIPYGPAVLRGVRGHRQVTDAYLAGVAEDRGARLATFDRALAVLRPGVVDLLT